MSTFQGYPNSDNTWEPKENLFACEYLLKEFEEREKKRTPRHAKKSLPCRVKREVPSDAKIGKHTIES